MVLRGIMKKIQTYIEGFDEVLDGGIPQGHVVLVCGTPGTMKTSLTYSIMYENAKQAGKKGLYISLEETYEGLKGAMLDLGMDGIDELPVFMIDVGKIRHAHVGQEMNKNWIDILQKYIKKRVDEDDFDIIVIDSLAALYSLAPLNNPRAELFQFVRFLKEIRASVFLISEISYGSTALVSHDEDFLVDGIIHLKMHEGGESDFQLRINCIKMRRTQHTRGWHRLMHTGKGFNATPIISD